MRTSRLALAALLALGAWPAAAHDGASHPAPTAPEGAATPIVARPAEEERARQYFTDLPVVTQDGQELRFFSDVLKDRVVLIGLFFTRCTEACPLTTAALAEVQDLLGEDLGRDFALISLTLDPENDTPEVLKSYAEKFHPRDGWLFLTGNPENVRFITRRLGHTGDDIRAHATQYFLGNVKLARWTKLAPNLPPAAIAEHFRRMAGYSEAQ
ncbi:MAG TPA: SCO family protein [Geminicoccaceae bacterium]|nr:SCO family protein [Geminicoccaceae bacterium]